MCKNKSLNLKCILFQNVQVKAEISLNHRRNLHLTFVCNVYKTALTLLIIVLGPQWT